MLLADFHIHSNCSTDAEDTMADMALAANKNGAEIVCFTDHCDIDAFSTGVFDPDCFAGWPGILKSYETAKRYIGGLSESAGSRNPNTGSAYPEIRLGLELGEANHSPELAAKIASQPELDFILGSVHNLRGTPDFYALRYKSAEHCAELTYTYLDELTELAGLTSFDCMSHIGYARRYMLRSGFDVAVEEPRFAERVDILLRRIIENGRGIEINCSGLRNPLLRRTIPDAPILKRYLELGGEIITAGSDAHRVADAAVRLKDGVELLKSLGYKYYTIYKNRRPEFIRIV